MIYKTLSQQLRETSSDDKRGIDSIVAEITNKSYKGPTEVVGLLHDSSLELQRSATAVYFRLGPLGFKPLLDSLPKDEPVDLAADLQALVYLHLDERVKLVDIIKPLFYDTRITNPFADFSPNDEKAPPRRVCDEAYLLIRKLLSFDETVEERLANEGAFVRMEEGEKDIEIQRFLKTKAWISLTESPE